MIEIVSDAFVSDALHFEPQRVAIISNRSSQLFRRAANIDDVASQILTGYFCGYGI